ncbi:MAG TPA: urease accessory UreF family protein [Ramlibacter sp.]|nr:urease accessory UreF family protein [Ramlibacter sp.]
MATRTDAALLQLIWLASPALPVGGFSYSEGLEAAVEAGHVQDEGSAAHWLQQQLQASLARADLAVVCEAVEAARRQDAPALATLDDWVRQTRETSELRQQAEQMGRSLGEWRRSLDAPASRAVPAGEREYTYPVAFAVAAAPSVAGAREVALAFAFAWSENMVQSAIKAVPLGQSAGQRILARLAREIPAAVDHAMALDATQRQAFSPMLAILSARHETQYSRLFRS